MVVTVTVRNPFNAVGSIETIKKIDVSDTFEMSPWTPVPLNVTWVAPVRWVPEMVTPMPPPAFPDEGVMLVIVGPRIETTVTGVVGCNNC